MGIVLLGAAQDFVTWDEQSKCVIKINSPCRLLRLAFFLDQILPENPL